MDIASRENKNNLHELLIIFEISLEVYSQNKIISYKKTIFLINLTSFIFYTKLQTKLLNVCLSQKNKYKTVMITANLHEHFPRSVQHTY